MEEGTSAFPGSSQPVDNQSIPFPTSMGDYILPVSDAGKSFYPSLGTVDETVQGATLIADLSRSTPLISNLPRIPSKPTFGGLIPTVAELEASLKNIVFANESAENYSISSAWIPSERTSGALHAIASSVPASDFMGADQLTKPGIMSDKLFVNPAFDFAMRFVGTIPPSVLLENPEQMINSNDVRGLLEKGFYSSAANVSAKLLYSFEQGYGRMGQVSRHSPQSLALWTYRITALTMLEQVELAAKELEAFGDLDNPDLYLEYYTQGTGEKLMGSMVPFHLRLLHARIPQRVGTPKISLERLFLIRNKIESMLKNASVGQLPSGIHTDLLQEFIHIWEQRRVTTLYHIVAVAIQSEDFDTAINLLRMLIKLCPDNAEKIWHNMGLLYCHIGTPKTAKICFNASEKAAVSEQNMEYSRLLHQAIVTVCEASPAQALDVYGEIFKRFPDNSSAVNGIAIAHFYSGRMAEAMGFLEKLVLGQPRNFLTEQSIRNLVAMYELQNIQVKERKLRLLSLICQYSPDGKGVNSLKLLES